MKYYYVKNETQSDILYQDTYPKMRYEGGGWTMCVPFKSKEEKDQKILPKPCCECGDHVYLDYDKEELIKDNICSSCRFWRKKLDIKDEPSTIRIKGQHYHIAPERQDGSTQWNGFGGRLFRIKRNDGKMIETTNLWHQGYIPAHFRDRLPDNAEFVEIPKPVGHGQGYLG